MQVDFLLYPENLCLQKKRFLFYSHLLGLLIYLDLILLLIIVPSITTSIFHFKISFLIFYIT